jgi:uncharacterized protein YPO0396
VTAPITAGFWELRQISLVNWYLFSWIDIQVAGRIAIIGPNGSGKSSLLDAVQTALMGGHGRYLRLNSRAQSDLPGRRSVKDYVLGVIDDGPRGSWAEREAANAYVLLGFRHTGTGEEATTGIALAARQDEDADLLIFAEI